MRPPESLLKLLQQGVATTHWNPLSSSDLFFTLPELATAQQSAGRQWRGHQPSGKSPCQTGDPEQSLPLSLQFGPYFI